MMMEKMKLEVRRVGRKGERMDIREICLGGLSRMNKENVSVYCGY